MCVVVLTETSEELQLHLELKNELSVFVTGWISDDLPPLCHRAMNTHTVVYSENTPCTKCGLIRR